MILLRHGETLFNTVYRRTRTDPGIRDPRLTEAGRGQAEEAGRALAGRRVGRIIASPYSRALETADIVAAALAVPISVESLVRERRLFACDVGSRRSTLARRWPRLDFDHLDEVWWPRSTESEAALLDRCVRFRANAAVWPDRDEIVVVTHWGFVRALTGVSLENAEFFAYDPS